MNADFLDAHERHWGDAEMLYQAGRWANADHLYGMAAECGLKRLMLVFNMRFDSSRDRPADDKDRKHANEIWDRFESYRSGHHQGARYGLPSINPFTDWHVSQRYARQDHFNPAHVDPHRRGAERIHQLINQASREGLL